MTETAQETLQEGITTGGVNFASFADTGKWAYSPGEIQTRLLDTAKSSALGFGFMGVAGDVISGKPVSNNKPSTEQMIVKDSTDVNMKGESNFSIINMAKGIFDKNIGTTKNFATQSDVDNYIDYAYRYADETNNKGNIKFPKQKNGIIIVRQRNVLLRT